MYIKSKKKKENLKENGVNRSKPATHIQNAHTHKCT